MFFNWAFLIWICAIPASGLIISPHENDINRFQEEKISDFKLKLRKIIDELAFLKRAMELERSMAPYVSTRKVQTRITKRISKGCTVQVDGTEIVFVVTSGNSSDPHILSEIRNAILYPIFEFPSYRSFLSLQALVDGRVVMLIAQHPTKKLRHFINIYEYDFRELKHVHKIRLNGLNLVSATKIRSQFYMVTVLKSSTFPTLKLYQIAKGQYNNTAYLRLNASCSGLETWNFGATLYVALSYVDSGRLEILQFHEYFKKFSLVQVIEVHAFVLKLFQEPGNTYLICGTRKSVKLYWWTGYRFREMYSTLFQKEIMDVAAHSFLGQIVIAVVFRDEVEFLTQDSAARYVSAGKWSFHAADSLKSVLLWKDNKRLFMMPLFKGKRTFSMLEVELKFDVSDPQKENALKTCFETLEFQMIQRDKIIEERNSKLRNLWRPSETRRISHLTVNGSIKTRSNATIRSLRLNSHLSSLMSLRNMNVQLREVAKNMNVLLLQTVRNSAEQRIHCDLRFPTLNVLNGTIGPLQNHVRINNVSSDLLSYALKKRGHQTIPHKMTFFTANFTRVTTDLLNNKRMEEYVLLNKGSVNMTGHFTFGNVSATSVRTHTINNINVPEIVLESQTQEITGLKSFKYLRTKSIQTREQREIHTRGITDLFYVYSKQFPKPVIFDPVLRIKGKLTVSLMNGKNLTQQLLNSVRRNDDTNIFGLKVFRSAVVNKTMTVSDGVNNIPMEKLMTAHTDQYIYGNVTFSDAIFQENIETVSLNGHDLKSEAVKTSNSGNEIKDLKTFRENFEVSDIIMDDGVQIDYFDPSEEKSKIMFKVLDNDSSSIVKTFSHDVTVGNIMAHNVNVARENFPVLEELDKVWLKTNEQNITFFKTEKMAATELEVLYANGIAMQSFVPVSEDTNIEGPITFAEKISTLSLRKAAKVDFPPEFWNPNILVKIPDNITLENPMIEGDVTISGVFENFENGFMNAAVMQDVKGRVKFQKIKLKELNVADLDFETLNTMNLKEYYDRSVLLSKYSNISNKMFRNLKGKSMKCYGTLNNVSLDKIATINTPQSLTSSYGLCNSTFKNISLNYLNGMQLEKVVYKDTNRRISNKNFTRNIKTPHLSTEENLNGVNLSKLNEEAFNITGTNETRARITFLGDVTFDKLQIRKNKTVDGVNLENLIILNETMRLHSFNVSSKNASINAENVAIKALINGCNVSRIFENALHLKGGDQNITGNVHVKTLEVRGNLSTKRANGADISAWIAVLNATSTSDTDSDVIFQHHLIADRVHILDTVNNVSLDFLFRDSVTVNSPQEISGVKRFLDFEVKNVNMSSVDVNNKLCGIDLLDIYKNSINKTAEKETILNSSLTFAHLEVENLKIDGKLNGLKIPEDVILSSVSEHVDGEIIINSTINATAGLNVTGKIDSVEMDTFLQDRVTLNATETISAKLFFLNDTHVSGNISIDGLINNISLYEVVKVRQNYTISGQKSFKEELFIMSNTAVSGYVNQLLTDILETNIPRISRNETLKGVINFSNLSLSALKSVTVNGINVMNFYNDSHRFVHEIRNKLHNFSSDIQEHQELMQYQADTVEHPLSLFNSFELQKILNFNYTEKLLPVYVFGAYGPKTLYDLQAKNVIVWVKPTIGGNQTEECRSTRSIAAQVSGDGVFSVTSRKWGKVFHFSLITERDGVVGFSVQAEYTNCTEEQKIRISALESAKKKKASTIRPPANATLLDVHLLEDEDVYLIFSYSTTGSSENSDRIFMFRYDVSANSWTSDQSFHAQDMTSVSMISVENDEKFWDAAPSVYLSVTGHERNPGVTIYEWDKDQFYLKTNISTSASSYSCWVARDETLYFLLSKDNKGMKSENGTRTAIFSETLEVYTLDEELVLNHTVKVGGLTSMDVFTLAGETFVLATSDRKGMVYVLQFRGFNGFEVVQEIPSPGATEARVFTADGHLYVGINSKTGPSKLWKAAISGARETA